jgi:hypothetical protein
VRSRKRSVVQVMGIAPSRSTTGPVSTPVRCYSQAHKPTVPTLSAGNYHRIVSDVPHTWTFQSDGNPTHPTHIHRPLVRGANAHAPGPVRVVGALLVYPGFPAAGREIQRRSSRRSTSWPSWSRVRMINSFGPTSKVEIVRVFLMIFEDLCALPRIPIMPPAAPPTT